MNGLLNTSLNLDVPVKDMRLLLPNDKSREKKCDGHNNLCLD